MAKNYFLQGQNRAKKNSTSPKKIQIRGHNKRRGGGYLVLASAPITLMKDFFTRGRNILFPISEREYLEGEYALYAPRLDTPMIKDTQILIYIYVVLCTNMLTNSISFSGSKVHHFINHKGYCIFENWTIILFSVNTVKVWEDKISKCTKKVTLWILYKLTFNYHWLLNKRRPVIYKLSV